jgi:hypothetical protein
MIPALRVILLAGALALAALIVRAALSADFFASFGAVADNPWGLVGLVDLYLGFVLFSVVMAATDGRRAWPWVLALFILGNVVSALWLVLRLARFLPVSRVSAS